MTTTTTELLSDYLDVTKMAVTGNLARYFAPTLTTCTLDLRTFVAWCQSHDLEMLRGDPSRVGKVRAGSGVARARTATVA